MPNLTPDDLRRLRELAKRMCEPLDYNAQVAAEGDWIDALRAASHDLLTLAERHHAVLAELRELAEHYGESHPAVTVAYRYAAALLAEGVDDEPSGGA
jgi:hypothetical protein